MYLRHIQTGWQKTLEAIKKKVVEIVLTAIVVSAMGLAVKYLGNYLKFIPSLYKEFPTIKQIARHADSCYQVVTRRLDKMDDRYTVDSAEKVGYRAARDREIKELKGKK